MHHDVHGHDSGAEAAGAASWLVAMVLFVFLMVLMIVALFAWAAVGQQRSLPEQQRWDNQPAERQPEYPNSTTQPQQPQVSP